MAKAKAKAKQPAKKPAKKAKPAKPAKTTTTDSPLAALVAKAVGGDRSVRTELRDQPAAKVVPLLVARFSDPDAKVRANAISLATGILPFAKLVPIEPLIAALGDPDASVRLAAVVTFKNCFPIEPFYKAHVAKIKPALAPCLNDSDKAVKEHAGHAAQLLGL